MTDSASLVTVKLLGVPVVLHFQAREHSDEMQREFRLLSEQLRDHDDGAVPKRLIELTRSLRSSYSGATVEQDLELEDAFAQGTPTLDLTYRVPVHAGRAAQHLGAMLDEADEYCREGRHLLTLATPPHLVDYRQWYLRQFTEQTAGSAPEPWAPTTSPSAREADPTTTA